MPRFTVKQLQTEQDFDFEGVIVIGRAPDNTIPIQDSEASRKHCQIEHTPGGWRLTDLNSKNGTKVNGKTVTNHPLRNGDIIQIGQVQIIYQSAPAADETIEAAGPVSKTAVGARVEQARQAEGERTRKRWNIASLAAALLFVLILIGAILAATLSHHGFEYSEAEKLLREATALEATDPAGAIQKYRQVPKHYPQLYTQALGRLRVLEPTDEAHKGLEASPEEIETFNNFSDFAKESPQEYDRILKLAAEFKQQYPTSKFFKDVDDFERQARETKERVMMDRFKRVQDTISVSMQKQEVGHAADALADFRKKFPEYAPAEEEHKKLTEAANRLYDEYDKKAQGLVQQGKLIEASTAYTDVMFLLDAPSKPFEPLVQAAQNRINKLHEQK